MICFSRGVLHVPVGALRMPWCSLFLPAYHFKPRTSGRYLSGQTGLLKTHKWHSVLILISLFLSDICREINSAASSSNHFLRMCSSPFPSDPYALWLSKLLSFPLVSAGHAGEEFNFTKRRGEKINVKGLGSTASLAHCLAIKSIGVIYPGRQWKF